ncbi:MAG: transposase [Bdellovibrionia bacterium]
MEISVNIFSMKARQLSLGNPQDEFGQYWKDTKRKFHGGSYAQGKRKAARPLDRKKPIHLVLSSQIARGKLSMKSPLNERKVDAIVHEYAKRFHVKIHDYANGGSHLHLNVTIPSREQFQMFLRTVTGLIARLILKAKKGEPKGKFWSSLAFTRVADWGKQLWNLKTYIFKNVLEASGAIPYDRENLKWVTLEGESLEKQRVDEKIRRLGHHPPSGP